MRANKQEALHGRGRRLRSKRSAGDRSFADPVKGGEPTHPAHPHPDPLRRLPRSPSFRIRCEKASHEVYRCINIMGKTSRKVWISLDHAHKLGLNSAGSGVAVIHRWRSAWQRDAMYTPMAMRSRPRTIQAAGRRTSCVTVSGHSRASTEWTIFDDIALGDRPDAY